MAYVPPSLRNKTNNTNNTNNSNMYNSTFKNFNKGRNNRYDNRYDNKNQRSKNIGEIIDVNLDFPKDNIKIFSDKFNVSLSLTNNKLSVCGHKEDIDKLKMNIDQYIKRNFKYNELSFPDMNDSKINTTNDEIKWGNKDISKISEDLEKHKFLKLIQDKKNEEQQILNKSRYNKYLDYEINKKISNLHLEEEKYGNDYEYTNPYVDYTYKQFLPYNEYLESQTTDEEQYNYIADKYSDIYPEFWLNEYGEEVTDDDIFEYYNSKKDKSELTCM
tara:strand:- start:2427 stop:3245 length:819 start_codon:yes stop_codon:yes gene_type:complete